eukprot:jgi/Botrbrau1/6066/Bobra.177_1s0006.1
MKRLEDAARGLEALQVVPQPWQGRLAHLASFPCHLAESLIMALQFGALYRIRDQSLDLFPDALLLYYARRAASFERWGDVPKMKQGHEVEVAAGVLAAAGLGTKRGVGVMPPPVLTTDELENARMRLEYRFLTAPDWQLVKAVTGLASSPGRAALLSLHVALESLLSQVGRGAEAFEGGGEASAADFERGLEAASLACNVLDHARSLLDSASLGSSSEAPSLRSGNLGSEQGDGGPSGPWGPLPDWSEEGLRERVVDAAHKADLLQTLLGNRVYATLRDLSTPAAVRPGFAELASRAPGRLAREPEMFGWCSNQRKRLKEDEQEVVEEEEQEERAEEDLGDKAEEEEDKGEEEVEEEEEEDEEELKGEEEVLKSKYVKMEEG